MAQPYLGEIRLFGGTFAPRDFAFCNGQFLSINENQALFSLIGTIYGGDGRTNFALPEMRGRVVMGSGQGPGLTNRILGTRFGQEEVALTLAEMPQHTHQFMASTNNAMTGIGDNAVLANTTQGGKSSYIERTTTPKGSNYLNDETIVDVGANKGHENRQPVAALNYIICIRGTYPSRN